MAKIIKDGMEWDSIDEYYFYNYILGLIKNKKLLPIEWFGNKKLELVPTNIEKIKLKFPLEPTREYLGRNYPAVNTILDFKIYTDKQVTIIVEYKGFNRFRRDVDEKFKDVLLVREFLNNVNVIYIKIKYHKNQYKHWWDAQEDAKDLRQEQREKILEIWKSLKNVLDDGHNEKDCKILQEFVNDSSFISSFRAKGKKQQNSKYVIYKKSLIDFKKQISNLLQGKDSKNLYNDFYEVFHKVKEVKDE